MLKIVLKCATIGKIWHSIDSLFFNNNNVTQMHIDQKEIWNKNIIYHHIDCGGKTLRAKDDPKGSANEVMMK
jgi:hypothetical protein